MNDLCKVALDSAATGVGRVTMTTNENGATITLSRMNSSGYTWAMSLYFVECLLLHAV